MNSLRTAAGAGALALIIAACGGSSEDSLEELIESQADGDVEIDIDEGEIRVQTSDGDFSLDIDQEDGGFSVEVDGEEVLSGEVDEDGGSIQVDGDGDGDSETVIQGDIGDDGDGSLTIQGEDGDALIEVGGSAEIPDDWPSDVPAPEGMSIESSSSFESGGQLTVTVTGSVSDGEEFIDDYIVALNEAGLPQTTSLEQDESLTTFHENSEWFVTVFAAPIDGTWQVSVSVISAA